MKNKVMVLLLAVAGLCQAPRLQAQAGGEQAGAVNHVEQLAAERSALQAMLEDANTPQEKRAFIQQLLEWNTRGVTIGEFKQRQAQHANEPAPQTPGMVVGSPPPAQNLAEAEAAPLPANVAVGGGSMLQSFSKGRDAESSARAAASLGLVKTQQEMENATRESEAKLREAQQIRNSAGASALAQRQQDAASVASQQAAGGLGAVLGDSLVQSVQQGAQAAGQAIGGGAVGRMGGALGSTASGGGAVAGGGGGIGDAIGGAASAGASAAAGQIFGGGTPAVEPAMGGGAPAVEPAMGGGVAVDENATMASGARLMPKQGAAALHKGASQTMDTLRSASARAVQSAQHVNQAMDAKARKVWDNAAHTQVRAAAVAAGRREAQPQGRFDAFCPKHGKYGGEISKGTACPRCESEKYQMWDAHCQIHGKYGGRGPVTDCPKCAKMYGPGFIR
jgi:hypothetical protein